MTSAIPPTPPVSASTPVQPRSGDGGSNAGNSSSAATGQATAASSTNAVVPTSGPASAAQVAPILAAAQAALSNIVNLSPQAQQAIKVEAFQQLVSSLVQQLQGGKVDMPANWPAGGTTPQLQALLTALVQQATAGQALPQQLVSAQSWPSTLAQAVLQHAGQTGSTPAGATGAGGAAAALIASAAGGTGNAPTPAIPSLQNWLVLQGSIQAQDGDRAFSLTLKVPIAWAQAQSALAAALPSAGAAGSGPLAGPGVMAGLQLPFAGSLQQLASGTMGLVMQPQAVPGTPAALATQLQALRTSAVLQLEMQPLPAAQAAQTAASVYLPGHLLPQDVQAALQGRGQDPWLMMAQAQANGHGQRSQQHANEQDGTCTVAGCQYQGRAVCAQPFCAQMNYLWSVDRAQRRL